MGDSGKARFYELDHESKMRLLKTHSHTSNRLAMDPGTREEKQLKETQTLQQGESHPSKSCRVPLLWQGGAEKALAPAACRRCGGRGQERLYGKATAVKVLCRGDPSSIWRATQALTQGRIIRKISRGTSKRREVRRGNDKTPGWKVAKFTAPLEGEVSRRRIKAEQIQYTKDKR